MSITAVEHSSMVLILCILFGTVILFGILASRRKPDSREPPYIKPRIPFVGHAFGILRYGVPYYENICTGPIFTLDLLVNRLYVIKSAKLVSAVQKNHKIISFDPFMTAAAKRMAGMDGPGLHLIRDTRSGGGDLSNKVLQAMIPSLLGDGLRDLNETMLQHMLPLVEELLAIPESTVDLHMWCRHIITTASTNAIWGSKNPFKSNKVVEDFWYFESHLSILLADLLPSLTARKALRARENVVQAMLDFTYADGYAEPDCSSLALARRETQKAHGATDVNIARLETAINIGILSNTVPAAFWTIFEIYSRPELLQAIRIEIEQNALLIDPNTNVHSIDLGRIKSGCPLLVSTFQEMLRVHSNGAPTRMVYEDIMLNDTYLLKAGSIVQISGPAINNEVSSWGCQAKRFDPSRFLNAEHRTNTRNVPNPKPRVNSFMSFGTSPNLCPGRHFASAEVLSLVAMLVMRAEITPRKGRWWTPELNAWAIAATVTPPKQAYPIKLYTRKGFKGLNWSFKMEGTKEKFDLVTG